MQNQMMEIDEADTSINVAPEPEPVPDFQPLKEQFLAFADEAERRWGDENFRKGWTFFTKKMGKYFKGSSSKLTRKLFDFGLEKKRKNNPVMHVQPASLARRKNKQRGRTAARYGRRHKDTVRRSEGFNEGGENPLLLHSIPGRINRNRGVPHNMQEIVSSNRAVAKKH